MHDNLYFSGNVATQLVVPLYILVLELYRHTHPPHTDTYMDITLMAIFQVNKLSCCLTIFFNIWTEPTTHHNCSYPPGHHRIMYQHYHWTCARSQAVRTYCLAELVCDDDDEDCVLAFSRDLKKQEPNG